MQPVLSCAGIMISLNSSKRFELLFCRCYKGDTAYSSTTENLNEEQTTAGAGGSAIGNGSSHNIVSITTSDVNALIANQNVSETAINAQASTAAYALQALEQSQANSNVVVGAAIENSRAQANDAENVAETVATNAQSLASQALAGAGAGSQVSFDNTSGGSSQNDSQKWILYLSVAASIATIVWAVKHFKK